MHFLSRWHVRVRGIGLGLDRAFYDNMPENLSTSIRNRAIDRGLAGWRTPFALDGRIDQVDRVLPAGGYKIITN